MQTIQLTPPASREAVRVALLEEIEYARHNGRTEEERGLQRALARQQSRWEREDEQARRVGAPRQSTDQQRPRCRVCAQGDCEDPDVGPSAYCTRLGCGAAHDEHAAEDEAADHCGQFTLTVDAGEGGESW